MTSTTTAVTVLPRSAILRRTTVTTAMIRPTIPTARPMMTVRTITTITTTRTIIMTTADIRMDQSGNIYEFVQNVKTIICLIVKCAEIQKNYSEACKKTNIMLKYKVYL